MADNDTPEQVDGNDEAEPDKDRDELEALHEDVKRFTDRMQRNAPKTAEAISVQLVGTVLPLIKEIAQKQLDLYDITMGTCDSIFDRLERLEAGVEDDNGLSDEELEKLEKFVGFANETLDHMIPTLEGDVRAKFEEMRKLGAECAEILEGDDDEDEPDGGSDDEPAEPQQGTN